MHRMLSIILPGIIILFSASFADYSISCDNGSIMICWTKLDAAYLMHDKESILHYVNSKNMQISLYAKSLLASLSGDFEKSVDFGKHCVNYDKAANSVKFMRFICLLDVSRNYGYMYRMKRHYNYLYKARNYAINEKIALEKISGHKFIQSFLRTSSFLTSYPKTWPTSTLSIKPHWRSIRMHNGMVDVLVDGKIIPMLVDTGSSGVMITTSDIKKYDLSNDLRLLSGGGIEHGYNKIYSEDGIFVANTLKFGPLTITSPYITVIDDKKFPKPYYSTIGINVLKNIGDFFYTSKYIVKKNNISDLKCSEMYIRIPVSGYAYGWGVFSRLHVSFGKGVYYIDTGLDSAYPKTALSIYKKYAKYLIKSDAVKIFTPIRLHKFLPASNGKLASNQVQFIKFNFLNRKSNNVFLASIIPESYRDSNPYFFGVYGVIGRNTIRNGDLSLYFDFSSDRICINHNIFDGGKTQF